MKIEGKPYSVTGYIAYLAALQTGPWRPSYVVIHHCAAPSLAQRPHGFQPQHMENLKDYYEQKNWSSGPHLFVDDSKIWTFSPLTARGTHAVSYNANGIGIEMLGDYDREDPWSGRGRQVLQNTAAATGLLLAKFGLGKDRVKFHRDDPKTDKTCPGKLITKEAFLKLL